MKYRVARQVKWALSGHGNWENELKPLADEDIRVYQDPNWLRPRTCRRGILEDDQADATTALDAMELDNSPQPNIDLLPQARSH